MFTSLSKRQRPQQSTKIKRKWQSSESVNEQEEAYTDQLQTPPNKRVCMSDLSQQGSSTPFKKVSSWIKDTVKKTVRIFRSFTEKYTFWQDEVDDDSDIAAPPCQHPVMNHSSLEQGSSRTYVTRGRDEAAPSYWKESSFEDNSTRRPLHEHSMRRRQVYDPSRYAGFDKTQNPLRKEFRPPSTTSYRKDTSSYGAVMNTSTNVRKTQANGPPQKSLKHNLTGTMTDSVVRLQEREQYRQLLAHYTSLVPMSTECSSIGTRSVDKEPKNNKTTDRTEISTKRNARREQSLLTSTLIPERSLHSDSTTQDVPQPVILQVSPATSQPRPVVVSKKVSADVVKVKDLPESGKSNRRTTSTRAYDLLDDGWITKWRETLSTESLQREREIAKEKLKLKAIQKEKNNYEKISEEVNARMRGKRPMLEDKVDSFKKLTPEMNCIVDKALGRGAPNEQLVETSLGHITRGDVDTLGQQNWLNDEIVNYYFHMIADRSKKEGPKVHSFNTFFFPKLIKTGHASLRRWTKKVDLFSMDMVLVPIHLGMHWCLAVIDFKTKTISYYDSLKGENGKCLQDLRDYLCAESLDKKKTKLDLTGWKSDTPQDIPEQLNGCDCGVFICKYAEYIARRATFDFTQYNMPYFRRRMIYEILSKTLL